MKLTTIIILAACLHTSAKGVAQQTITFSGKEVSLESVFSAIKKQTNYRFFFNTDMLSSATKVTLEVKNAQVEQVMNMALKDQPLTFTIKGRTIFVMKKQEEEKKSTQVERTGDPITVSGRVTDDQGQPLAGANVKVKGGNNGVTTDAQGRFTLNNVDPNASLEISFVGHEMQFISLKGKSAVSIILGQKLSMLDETVVIAYGTTSRRLSTGNVSSIKASDIEKQPVNNPLLALQGRVPGLFINQNTGVPGGGITVRIQGQNSIAGGNDPLIVVDGVPYYSQLPQIGTPDNVLGSSGGRGNVSNGNPLSYINPNDIESIDILKDADATAIYGSRAANGAILITTKKGKTGKAKIDASFQQGWGKVTRKMEMLDRRRYLDMRYEGYKNDAISISNLTPGRNTYDLTLWDTTQSTDWQNTLIGGTAKTSNVNASISGGSSSIQYLISSTYRKESSVFPGDFNNQKASVHFSINTSASGNRFKLQLSGNYLFDDNKLPSSDLTEKANLLEPVAPSLFNSDGTLNWAMTSAGVATWDNPMVSVLHQTYSNQTSNLLSNLTMGYMLFDGLEIKSSFGFSNIQTTDFMATPLVAIRPERRVSTSRSAYYGNRSGRSWIIEPQLVYKKKFWRGKIEGLIGGSIQQAKSVSGSLLGRGYSSDQVLEDFKAATTLSASASFMTSYKYNGLFARMNYNLDEKYILNLTARRDGSSRFGSKNQFHSFGSVGFGWILSQEKFISKNLSFLSFAKLRGNLGTTGNDQIGDYQYLSLYDIITGGIPYQNMSGLLPSSLSNPYLQWEETRKIQTGIDLGFLSDRIFISATYVLNRSSNQLLQYILPSTTGYSSITENFPATVQNTSWELALNATILKKQQFNWSSSLNFTIPKNKLVDFPNLENSTYSSELRIGEPLGSYYIYHFSGVNAATGLYEVYDSKGVATSSPNSLTDRTVLFNNLPKFYGGFQNRITLKGLELDFIFQFVSQKGANNQFNNGSIVTPGAFLSGSSNQPITVLDRWQNPGDNASIQKFSSSYTSANASLVRGLVKVSDASFTDASYVRLKNISFSWRPPAKWIQKISLQDCKLFVHGQNLITITNYEGADPENQGFQTLPPLRVIQLGVSLGL